LKRVANAKQKYRITSNKANSMHLLRVLCKTQI